MDRRLNILAADEINGTCVHICSGISVFYTIQIVFPSNYSQFSSVHGALLPLLDCVIVRVVATYAENPLFCWGFSHECTCL